MFMSLFFEFLFQFFACLKFLIPVDFKFRAGWFMIPMSESFWYSYTHFQLKVGLSILQSCTRFVFYIFHVSVFLRISTFRFHISCFQILHFLRFQIWTFHFGELHRVGQSWIEISTLSMSQTFWSIHMQLSDFIFPVFRFPISCFQIWTFHFGEFGFEISTFSMSETF